VAVGVRAVQYAIRLQGPWSRTLIDLDCDLLCQSPVGPVMLPRQQHQYYATNQHNTGVGCLCMLSARVLLLGYYTLRCDICQMPSVSDTVSVCTSIQPDGHLIVQWHVTAEERTIRQPRNTCSPLKCNRGSKK
jgi:hypothetical protein